MEKKMMKRTSKYLFLLTTVLIFLIVTIIYGTQNGNDILDYKKLVGTNYDSIIPYLKYGNWSKMSNKEKKDWILNYKEFIKDSNPSYMDDKYFPKNGLVNNEETAIKIAEIYWHRLYGDKIYYSVPFVAVKITDSVWQVTSVVPIGQMGGDLFMDIKAINGQVLCIGIGK
jgi:hypothetical protein